MTTLDEARAALRARQGAGARYDAAEAPVEALGWARLGTAYVARLLNDLPDEALRAPSTLPGWTRAHVVAQVGYQARALTRLTSAAAGSKAPPMYASDAARIAEVEQGATLPARALRGLFDHAAVHLDVEWRDLPGAAWDQTVVLPDGRRVPVRETAWLRARELWLRALDLDAGGSLLDAPAGVVDRLLEDLAAGWSGPALTLTPVDRAAPVLLAGGGADVRGRTADLARWAAGRDARRLRHDAPLPSVAPAFT